MRHTKGKAREGPGPASCESDAAAPVTTSESARFVENNAWNTRTVNLENGIVSWRIELRAAGKALSEWRQAITVVCTMVLAVAAVAALILSELGALRAQMQTEHAAMRAEMQTEHATMRAEMQTEHAAMRAEMQSGLGSLRAQMQSGLGSLRAEMQTEFGSLRAEMQTELGSLRAQMQSEHASIRDQLNSVDRRTARIEGHLFGIEIAPEQLDGE